MPRQAGFRVELFVFIIKQWLYWSHTKTDLGEATRAEGRVHFPCARAGLDPPGWILTQVRRDGDRAGGLSPGLSCQQGTARNQCVLCHLRPL